MSEQRVSFCATTPDEADELYRFLAGVFGMTSVPPPFTPEMMAWKYFDPHPWWPDGRSYVLRTPDGIAAHGCATPVRFSTDCGEIESMQIIDWAAGRLLPAAGLLLYRKCLETSKGTLLAIGGSEDTKAIIPQLRWFKRKDDIRYYVRPLRPWRHLAISAKKARDLARFARNLSWRFTPPVPSSGVWTCRPALPGESICSPEFHFASIRRSRAWFDYLLRCPMAKSELVILEKAGRTHGHAFLAHVQGSVRVADFLLTPEQSHIDRVAAFAALTRHIGANPDAAEIVAGSSLQEVCNAFEACGMRPRGTAPVYLADPRKLLPADARLEITALIGDAFYLYDPAYPFTC